MHIKKRYLLIFLLLQGFLAIGQVINIENFRIKTDTTGWFGSLGMQLRMVKNTKKLLDVGTSLHLERKGKKDLWLCINKLNFIRADNEDFINNGFQHFRYNYKILPRLTTEAFAQGQYNHVLKIKQRYLAGSGLRVKWSNAEKIRLYTGVAYMYEYEELIKPFIINRNHRISSYWSMNFFLWEHISFVSTSYFQPKINYLNDYRIASDNVLILEITKKWQIKSGFDMIFDKNPPLDIPQLVYNMTHSLVLKL